MVLLFSSHAGCRFKFHHMIINAIDRYICCLVQIYVIYHHLTLHVPIEQIDTMSSHDIHVHR